MAKSEEETTNDIEIKSTGPADDLSHVRTAALKQTDPEDAERAWGAANADLARFHAEHPNHDGDVNVTVTLHEGGSATASIEPAHKASKKSDKDDKE